MSHSIVKLEPSVPREGEPMNKEEFLGCSDVQMWAEILLDQEPYLPEAAETAYIEMTNEEPNKLYEASGLVLTEKTLQLYELRITAKGYDSELEITRGSVPISAVRVETRSLANDENRTSHFEEIQYRSILRLSSSAGPFGDEIALPIKERGSLQRKARQRIRNFVDSVALAVG
jgi:hypothetical protein